MATELRPDVKPLPLHEMAREYVKLLHESEPDRLGRYVHDTYGTSSHMLYLMTIHYGADEADRAINRAFKEWS